MSNNVIFAIKINLAILFIVSIIAAGACSKHAAHAEDLPAQPVVPKGFFEICVVDQQGQPVPEREFSIQTESDGDVVTGFTANDGCRHGEIVAGPAHFEIGTGIVHDAVVHDKETVREVFTYPPFEQNMPQVAAP